MTSDLGAKTRLFRCGDTVRADAEQESFRSKRNEKCESSQTSGGTTTKTQDITIARFQAAYQSRFAATFCGAAKPRRGRLKTTVVFGMRSANWRSVTIRIVLARVAYLSFGTSSKLITSCPIMSEETTMISGCATPKNSRTAIQYSLHSGPDETLFSPALPVAARFLHDPQITWPSLELVSVKPSRFSLRRRLRKQRQAGQR
jgi:hypothetical protein